MILRNSERLKEKHLTIKIKPKAKEYLIENGYNPSMGARPMKRLLRKEIEDPLSMEILKNQGKDFDVVQIDCSKDLKLKVKLTKSKKETVSVPKEKVVVR